MIEGSCLCGAVAYRAARPGRTITYCHCSFCRKTSGSAFSANVRADRDGFEVVRGADRVNAYESSPGKLRCSCAVCGSQLFAAGDKFPDQVIVRLGTVDRFDEFADGVEERHLFPESEADAPWVGRWAPRV